MSVPHKGRVAVGVMVAVLATLVPAGIGFNAAGAQTAGAAGVWETTDSLSVPRYDHTTTREEVTVELHRG